MAGQLACQLVWIGKQLVQGKEEGKIVDHVNMKEILVTQKFKNTSNIGPAIVSWKWTTNVVCIFAHETQHLYSSAWSRGGGGVMNLETFTLFRFHIGNNKNKK